MVISENQHSTQVRESLVFKNKQGPCFWVLRMGMSCVLLGERESPTLMQLSAEQQYSGLGPTADLRGSDASIY